MKSIGVLDPPRVIVMGSKLVNSVIDPKPTSSISGDPPGGISVHPGQTITSNQAHQTNDIVPSPFPNAKPDSTDPQAHQSENAPVHVLTPEADSANPQAPETSLAVKDAQESDVGAKKKVGYAIHNGFHNGRNQGPVDSSGTPSKDISTESFDSGSGRVPIDSSDGQPTPVSHTGPNDHDNHQNEPFPSRAQSGVYDTHVKASPAVIQLQSPYLHSTAGDTITVGTQTVSAGPNGYFIDASTTLQPGGSAVTLDGTRLSLEASGVLHLGTSVTTLFLRPSPDPSADTITIVHYKVVADASHLVADGSTVSSTIGGGSVMVSDRTTLSLGTAKIVLHVGTSATTITAAQNNTTAAGLGGNNGSGGEAAVEVFQGAAAGRESMPLFAMMAAAAAVLLCCIL